MDPKQNERPGRTVLAISDMTCDGCAKTVTRVLSHVPGVTSTTVDFASGHAMVMGSARPEDLVAAVQAAGYGAQLSPGDTAGGA